MHSSTHDSGCVSEFPALIDLRLFNAAEKLSPEQAGHLRHFHNLASQEDGQWGLMGAQFSAQEWVDGYRYQLATMAYAAGAAHYHRLPALRSCFKKLLQDLISKMLRPEVWSYWFNTSHSGKFVDPDIKELRKPWADPIVRENIMVGPHFLPNKSFAHVSSTLDIYYTWSHCTRCCSTIPGTIMRVRYPFIGPQCSGEWALRRSRTIANPYKQPFCPNLRGRDGWAHAVSLTASSSFATNSQ